MRRLLAAVAALALVACSDDAPSTTADVDVDAADAAVDAAPDAPDAALDAADAVELPPADYTTTGPWGVGHTTLAFERDGRAFAAEVWYPAPAGTAPDGTGLDAFGRDADQTAALRALLDDAPASCPTRATLGARDAEVAEGGPWPLVVYSHCHECLRTSGLHLGERLASHGVVMAAVEHVGNTLFDAITDDGLALDTTTLDLRAADATQVLDALIAADGPLAGRVAIDAARVGVAGHSFGAVTAGRLLQDHPAPIAGVAFAAPMENPLLPGVSMAAIDEPVLFVVAVEDNSITEFGNTLLRDNAAAAAAGSWRVEVPDAGHWSFSDLCGLVAAFDPGCGEGRRQTDPSATFSYLDPTAGRQIAASLGAAFFAEQLVGDTGAMQRAVDALVAEQLGAASLIVDGPNAARVDP